MKHAKSPARRPRRAMPSAKSVRTSPTCVTALSTQIRCRPRIDRRVHAQNFATDGSRSDLAGAVGAGPRAVRGSDCQGCITTRDRPWLPGRGSPRLLVARAFWPRASVRSTLRTHLGILVQDCPKPEHSKTPPFHKRNSSVPSEPFAHIPTGTGASCAPNSPKGGFRRTRPAWTTKMPRVVRAWPRNLPRKGCRTRFYGTAQTQAGGQPMPPPGTVGVLARATTTLGTDSAQRQLTAHTAAAPATAAFQADIVRDEGHRHRPGVVVSGANCDNCHEWSAWSWMRRRQDQGASRTAPHGQDCGATQRLPQGFSKKVSTMLPRRRTRGRTRGLTMTAFFHESLERMRTKWRWEWLQKIQRLAPSPPFQPTLNSSH